MRSPVRATEAADSRENLLWRDIAAWHRRTADRMEIEIGWNARGHRRDPSAECGHRNRPAGHHCCRIDAAVAPSTEHELGVLGGMGDRYHGRRGVFHAVVVDAAGAGLRQQLVSRRRRQAHPGRVVVAPGSTAMARSPGRGRDGRIAEVDVGNRLHDRVKALGLGFLLAAVNPKNLLLAASAGVIIGSAALSLRQAVAVVTIYVVLAACTVLIPVSAYLLASVR